MLFGSLMKVRELSCSFKGVLGKITLDIITLKGIMFYLLWNRQIKLAYLGLMSMILLTLGPLVGQLTIPNMSSMPMSAMSMMQMSGMAMSSHVGHDHSKMVMAVSTSHSDHGAVITMDHAWDEACGYCSFFDHFPFLSISIPSIVFNGTGLISTPIEFIRSAFNSDSLFLHALKRAPPYLRDELIII
jgi:hypothetical protein